MTRIELDIAFALLAMTIITFALFSMTVVVHTLYKTDTDEQEVKPRKKDNADKYPTDEYEAGRIIYADRIVIITVKDA